MSQWINVHALWQILVAGLICGAGLPALFSFGLRALSVPAKAQEVGANNDRLVAANARAVAIAGVCFALTVIAVGWGIYFIVSGG